MVFQRVFATVTMAIVTSGIAERVKFSAYLVFALLWTTIVYDPLAHWVWGGGWAAQFGSLDFAGGTVVHISSGFAALALALVIGKRVGFGTYSMEPTTIPLTLLGAALLWFGWFGFNAGSALGANGLAAQAFVTTNTAAAAGLVAITPAAGYVTPMAALLIGAVGGIICYGMLLFRLRKGRDESLDAWAIHGIGGLWGHLQRVFSRWHSSQRGLGSA
jgi:Amt family ammonium transporter